MTLHSIINDPANYNSDKDDTESDPKIDPLVAPHTSDRKKRKVADTDTTNGNSPQTLLINRTIPVIILPINPPIVGRFPAGIMTVHVHQTIALKLIVTDVARIGACVFQYPEAVNWKDTDGTIPWDGNISIRPSRLFFAVVPLYPQLERGARRLAIQSGPSVLWKSGTPNYSTLPLMEILPKMGILRQLSVR